MPIDLVGKLVSKEEIEFSDDEKKQLIEHVYRPCFNQMMNEYKQREFITGIPSNKWRELEHFWQLKTEPEMKELFEKYTNELAKWHKMWIDFGNKFMENKEKLGEVWRPVFEKYGLLDQRGYMKIGRYENSPQEWLHNCQDVIFNIDIHDGEELYRILKKDAVRRYGEEYSLFFDEWYRDKPEIYTDILKTIPELVNTLDAKFSYAELDEQRKVLKDAIEKLTIALESKLK